VTYLTNKNSLKLWNWHIQSDIQNHLLKHVIQNLEEEIYYNNYLMEFENPTDIRSYPHVSGKKQNLEQRIIETVRSHIHSLIDNFEAYFPKQQATELQAVDFESFTQTASTKAFGHKPEKWPMSTSFINSGKHAKFW